MWKSNTLPRATWSVKLTLLDTFLGSQHEVMMWAALSPFTPLCPKAAAHATGILLLPLQFPVSFQTLRVRGPSGANFWKTYRGLETGEEKQEVPFCKWISLCSQVDIVGC